MIKVNFGEKSLKQMCYSRSKVICVAHVEYTILQTFSAALTEINFLLIFFQIIFFQHLSQHGPGRFP